MGPAVQLFSADFYRECFAALKEDGMLVAQSESPFFNADVIKMAYGGINQVFPLTKLYLANIPTYPSGLWSFTIGSKKHDLEEIVNRCASDFKYYNEGVHQAAFKLPGFVNSIIRENN